MLGTIVTTLKTGNHHAIGESASELDRFRKRMAVASLQGVESEMDRDVWESFEAERPQWLEQFCDRVTVAIQSSDETAAIGCHFHREVHGDTPEWEVTLFVSDNETLRCELDRELGPPRFLLDLREILTTFDVLASFYWQAQRMADDDQIGPHVGMTGEYKGHQVWLRVAAKPPDELCDDWGLFAETSEDRW